MGSLCQFLTSLRLSRTCFLWTYLSHLCLCSMQEKKRQRGWQVRGVIKVETSSWASGTQNNTLLEEREYCIQEPLARQLETLVNSRFAESLMRLVASNRMVPGE